VQDILFGEAQPEGSRVMPLSWNYFTCISIYPYFLWQSGDRSYIRITISDSSSDFLFVTNFHGFQMPGEPQIIIATQIS